MEGGREGGKKIAAAGLCIGIKTGANPSCIVQHYPLPLLSPTLPLRALWRDILQTVALICQTMFSKTRTKDASNISTGTRLGFTLDFEQRLC